MRTRLFVLTVAVACAAGAIAQAQGRGGAPWSTVSGDAQRSAWVRSDPKITKEAVQKGGFQFLWKSKLDNEPRELNALTQPLLLPNIISYKGFKALAFIGGSSDNVYAIDYDLNRPFWKRHLETGSTTPATSACPGGLTAITRDTPLAPPNPNAGRGSFLGAGGGANAPGARGQAPAPRGGAPGALPPGAGAPGGRGQGGGRGAGGGRGGGRQGSNNVFAISSGGMLHALNPQTGEDVTPAVKLFAPNATVVGSILIDSRVYAATSGNCGSAGSGVYALDLGTDGKGSTVVSWDAKGATIAGLAAPAFSQSGTVYVATGGGQSPSAHSVVALDPTTLTQNDAFIAATPFTSSPVVLTVGSREVVAAVNRDGRLYLLDGASLGGADRKTPLAKTEPFTTSTDFTPNALATWQEADGTRWVLAPASGAIPAAASFPTTNGSAPNGSIVAFKVVDRNGAVSLQPGWVSRDLTSPLTPAIVNGIVFALAGGESRGGAAAERVKQSKPAVLYALDASTGKELWSSGTTITSFAHAFGPSAGDSQVYVVTHDGTVYAFGIPLEH